MDKIYIDKKEECDGYISKIKLSNGRVYKLRCEIVEVYPMICPKCGGSLTLKYGHGKCNFCGTNYAANFKITET